MRGGDTKPVDGGDEPRIESDEPPPTYRDLVTDPGPEGGATETIDAPRGAPDAPVVHTINPDSGFLPPLAGGAPAAGGGGDGDVLGMSSVGETVDPGPGALHSFTAESQDEASLADASARQVGIIIPDTDRPVESLHSMVPDLADGLSADLNADLAPAVGEFAPLAEVDPGGADLLEGSLPGDTDGDGFPDS